MATNKVFVITGMNNTGKTSLLTKLYETILRWYDNHEIHLNKKPINSYGDFFADITIMQNTRLKNPKFFNKEKEHHFQNINYQSDKRNKSIRILINTAGDIKGNFKDLENIELLDYDFIILAKNDKFQFSKLSSKSIELVKDSYDFSCNISEDLEKNLLKIITSIVNHFP